MDLGPVVPFAAVALGGALGALSRFCVYRAVETAFPWATFIVNIVGCCLASFLMFRYGIYADGPMKTMVFTGFFGAFTTMSTFSIDTVNLLCDGQYWQAGGNIVLNSVVCVLGAIGGRYLAVMWMSTAHVVVNGHGSASQYPDSHENRRISPSSATAHQG